MDELLPRGSAGNNWKDGPVSHIPLTADNECNKPKSDSLCRRSQSLLPLCRCAYNRTSVLKEPRIALEKRLIKIRGEGYSGGNRPSME
jgi:hypothetical protein